MRLKLPKSKERLRREAASWLARLQSGRDPDVESRFRQWYDGNPAHASAFDRVRQSYDSAALLRHSKGLDERVPDRRARGRPVARYALAGAVALAVLIPASLVLTGDRVLVPFGRTNMLMLRTGVGEIRVVRLSDGSAVTLDTATVLQVEIGRSKRFASLRKGRARFSVAGAAKPFVIEAGEITITTSEGLLDVEQEAAATHVNLLSGMAAIGRGSAPEKEGQLIGQGKGLSFIPGKPLDAHPIPDRPDWTKGMLHFDGTPFAEAVELANRYSTRRIVLEPGLEELRVTGAFRTGDTDGLAKALAAAFNLSLRSTADGRLILSRRSAAQRAASRQPA